MKQFIRTSKSIIKTVHTTVFFAPVATTMPKTECGEWKEFQVLKKAK